MSLIISKFGIFFKYVVSMHLGDVSEIKKICEMKEEKANQEQNGQEQPSGNELIQNPKDSPEGTTNESQDENNPTSDESTTSEDLATKDESSATDESQEASPDTHSAPITPDALPTSADDTSAEAKGAPIVTDSESTSLQNPATDKSENGEHAASQDNPAAEPSAETEDSNESTVATETLENPSEDEDIINNIKTEETEEIEKPSKEEDIENEIQTESEEAKDTNENEAINPLHALLKDTERQWAEIKSNGELHLKETAENAGRKIAELTSENADTILNKLREQYEKIKTEIQDLSTKFELEGDQVVLYPDVLRTLNYLNTVQALGNLSALIATTKTLKKRSESKLNERVTERKQLLDQFRALLDEGIDSIRDADLKTKEIFAKWKNAGHLPSKEFGELNDELRKLQDEYTVKRRESQQKLDYQYLNNLDRKKEIIEKANKIADADALKGGHEQMQALFDEWKEIGKVPLDQKDKIWKEFSDAKNRFYERKKEHYDELFTELEENFNQKNRIVTEIEELQDSTDWKNTTEKIHALDNELNQYGRVPNEKRKELYDRLHAAKRKFFGRKKENFEERSKDYEANLITKTDLANRAEALKDSKDWRETTIKMNKLFDEWKASGPTFRSKEQQVWKKFIAARKHFYAAKDAYFDELNKKKFKENIIKLDREKENLNRMKSDLALDLETLEALNKDYETEQNARFKSKIKETLDVLSNKISNEQKNIKNKENWIQKTQADIDRLEAEAAAEKKAQETPSENVSKKDAEPIQTNDTSNPDPKETSTGNENSVDGEEEDTSEEE